MEWKKVFHKSKIYPIVLVGLMYAAHVYYKEDAAEVVEVPEKETVGIQRFEITGTTMGSIPYRVIYYDSSAVVLKTDVDSLLVAFNDVFSTYISSSEISSFNNSGAGGVFSKEFTSVVRSSIEISKQTNGAFDATVFPLIQLWGFGPSKERDVELDEKIKSALLNVGYQKMLVQSDSSIVKEPGVTIDLSAIAKGYASDVVASFLIEKGVTSGFVEIGGEVYCFGEKEGGVQWGVGIRAPSKGFEVKRVLKVRDRAVATSGNYEQVKYDEDGKAYSHTIDPRTGMQIKSSVLSATVVAPTCMEADAYATACMVLGVEKSASLIGTIKGVELYLMYEKDGVMSFYETEGLKQFYDQ
jgi:thiamine biosynthesis lipoprotein